MEDFTLRLQFDAPPERVFDAVGTKEGPGRWWTALADVDPRVGGRAHFPFPDAGFHATFEITRLERPRVVEWRCLDSKHPESSGWSDLTDWNSTTVRFEIEPTDEGSQLTFTHVGLLPRLECNATCRSTWKFYLDDSLRGLVEEGKGKPFGTESGS